jgi:NarL family two-component system response regulator LiaR
VTETHPIRVLIVDDHEMVRTGLSAFLKTHKDLEMVGEAGNGEEAVALCKQLCPDVALMDMVMPGMDGPAAIRAIRRLCPQTRIIALTSFKEQDLVSQAIDAGALGFLYKNVSSLDLAKAIRAAAVNQPTMDSEALQALMRTRAPSARLGHDLTDRERDVLALMVRGLNNVEIANHLVVSRSTVKAHVSNILAKLGVTSRTEAVAIAVEHKLVSGS